MFLKLLPVWAPCAAIVGFIFDVTLAPLGESIVPLLMIVMLCMGLTLSPSDFLKAAQYKTAVIIGVVLQFTIMPLTALLIAYVCGLSEDLTVGLVLVGSIAGGTSSNVIAYLAGGNVALSVSMTALSTLISIVMTPLLLVFLVGSNVDIPAIAMLVSLFKIILLPITLGVIINVFAHQWTRKIRSGFAPLSVIAVLAIIAIVVAINADNFVSVGVWVVLATLVHNVSGLVLGYLSAYFLGFDRVVCRTIAIEVGMQNSGLATALAVKLFSPMAALPGAVFSVWLNVTGSMFASSCVYIDTQRSKNCSKKSNAETGAQDIAKKLNHIGTIKDENQ